MANSTMNTNWQSMRLVDFVTIQRGHDLPEHQREIGNIPIMGSFGITGYHNVAKVKGPGVTIGRSGASIGVVCYTHSDYWPLNTALYVTDFHGNDEIFTYYFLQTLNLINHNSGSAQPSLNRNYIYPIPVKIPTFSEQRDIATTLSDIDTLITSLDKLIAKKRDIKQATMQQLLTGKRRLTEFSRENRANAGYKQTEIGAIPEDWEVAKIGDCAFVTKLAGFEYTNYFDYRKSGPIIAVRALNIKDGKLDLTDVHTLPYETSKLLPRSQLAKGDLVISYVGTLGRVAVIPEDGKFHLAPNVAKIRVNTSQIDPFYLNQFLNGETGQKAIFKVAASTTQAALSMHSLREVPFILPPLLEQQAIATVLTDMGAEIVALEQRRDKTRALKQGMMQELLTGKTRLI